ncbi:MAG TPA: hypothetical protein PK858_12665, partial [Saprospiraceae bacterium]|nr:hypothetical protein [Saprospiraceae bacterium]
CLEHAVRGRPGNAFIGFEEGCHGLIVDNEALRAATLATGGQPVNVIVDNQPQGVGTGRQMALPLSWTSWLSVICP